MRYIRSDTLSTICTQIKLLLSEKADKNGKGPVTQDFTDEDLEKLLAIQDDLAITDTPTFQNVTVRGRVIGAQFR